PSHPGPVRIRIHKDRPDPALDVSAIASFLSRSLPADVEIAGDLASRAPAEARAGLARALAPLRVLDPTRRWTLRVPFPPEARFEERVLSGAAEPRGIAYEGHALQVAFRDLLRPRDLDTVDIVLTGRLFVTWGEDGRYHFRVAVLGAPALVSTTGLVEAPARPREYYVKKQALLAMRAPVTHEVLREGLEGRLLDPGDARLTECAKGYALAAVLYQATGETWCDDKECRLYDAHWQEDLLRAQVTSGRLCARHTAVVDRVRAPEK
ncbi:MAG: DUF6775 family putative metallopeptidase, partial [Methanobacteriota archaeon]